MIRCLQCIQAGPADIAPPPKQQQQRETLQRELRALWAELKVEDGVPASQLYRAEVCGDAKHEDVAAFLSRLQISKRQKLGEDEFVAIVPRVRASAGTAPVSLSAAQLSEWVARLQAIRAEAQPETRNAALDEADPGPAQLAPWLYLGSKEHSADMALLRRLGVGSVLNCAATECKDPLRQYAEANVAHAEIGALDRAGYPLVVRHAEEATAQIRQWRAARGEGGEGGGATLVHCVQGINRGATVAVLALMTSEQPMSLPDAVRHTVARRPAVLCNRDFLEQLVRWAAAEGRLNGPNAPPK